MVDSNAILPANECYKCRYFTRCCFFLGYDFFFCCCCSHLNLKPWCELSSAWNWPLGPEDMQQRLNTINLFRLKTYFLKISEGGHADSVLPQCDEVPLWMNDSKPGLIFTFDDLLLFFTTYETDYSLWKGVIISFVIWCEDKHIQTTLAAAVWKWQASGSGIITCCHINCMSACTETIHWE